MRSCLVIAVCWFIFLAGLGLVIGVAVVLVVSSFGVAGLFG